MSRSQSRSLSPPRLPSVCRLGILGTRNQVTSAEITDLLDLIVGDTGPDIQAIYLPQEGMSSIYAEAYAEEHDIPVTSFEASWVRHGRSAVARRDAQIVAVATHFLVFGGPRSNKPLKVATDLATKGRTVYYLPHGSLELELLEVTCPEPTKPDRKTDTGKGNSRQPTLKQIYS